MLRANRPRDARGHIPVPYHAPSEFAKMPTQALCRTVLPVLRGRRVGDGGFHIDHIHHHGRGGRNLIGNGRVLCGTCNTSRGNRANAARYGINKYRGLHRGRTLKDYRSIRRNY